MMKDFVKRHGVFLFAYSILAGIVLSLVSRTVYVLFFLPEFHGSWGKAVTTIVDVKGWWAYMTSPFGLTISVLTLVLVLGAPTVLIVIAYRDHNKDA
jgi:hypothetical protein